jgi:hypothetical protein
MEARTWWINEPSILGASNPTDWEPLIRTLLYMVLRAFATSFRRLDRVESVGLWLAFGPRRPRG